MISGIIGVVAAVISRAGSLRRRNPAVIGRICRVNTNKPKPTTRHGTVGAASIIAIGRIHGDDCRIKGAAAPTLKAELEAEVGVPSRRADRGTERDCHVF